MKTLPIILVIGCVAACRGEKCGVDRSDAPTTTAAAETERVAPGFGSDDPGFVEWVSGDGEYVLLQRFFRDTNLDGKIEAKLGDHGEVAGDEPTPELYNLVDGTRREFDEVIALGPRMRSLVLRRGDDIKVFDTATGHETDLPASAKGDPENPCLPSRQAVFDPTGERIAFITPDNRPAVYSIGSRETHIFEPVEGLWRVAAVPIDGAVVVQVVREDTDGDGSISPPVAKTTCSSRWAARFASSVGNYGWHGDEYEQFLVMPDGTNIAFDGQLVPVGPDVVWGPSGGLMYPSGDEVELPRGCQLGSVPLGSESVLVQCGPHVGVWDPPSGAPEMLETPGRPVEPLSIPVRPDASQSWTALLLETREGTRIGRVDLSSGAADEGPSAKSVGRPHPSGWLLGTGSGLVAYNLGTGVTTTVADTSGSPNGLTVQSKTGLRAVDPHTGETQSMPVGGGLVTSSGCVVTAAGAAPPFDRGPWRLRCPR